jgi:hypothetical protein
LAAFFLPPFLAFLAAFFLVAILSFSFLVFLGYDHKIMCCCNSCGLEKTAHNMLLYKLNSHACQQFITCELNYFARRIALRVRPAVSIHQDLTSHDREIERPKFFLRRMKVHDKSRRMTFDLQVNESRLINFEMMREASAEERCEDPVIVSIDAVVRDH